MKDSNIMNIFVTQGVQLLELGDSTNIDNKCISSVSNVEAKTSHERLQFFLSPQIDDVEIKNVLSFLSRFKITQDTLDYVTENPICDLSTVDNSSNTQEDNIFLFFFCLV